MEKASVSASYETRCLNDYGPLMLMKFVKNHLLRFGQSQLSSVQFSSDATGNFLKMEEKLRVCTPSPSISLSMLCAILCHRHVVPPHPVPTIPHGPHCEALPRHVRFARQAHASQCPPSLTPRGILLGLFLDMHFGGALASVSVRLFRFFVLLLFLHF